MSVTIDGTPVVTVQAASTNTVAATLTVGSNPNRALAALISNDGTLSVSSMNEAGWKLIGRTNFGGQREGELWAIANPATGSYTATATLSGNLVSGTSTAVMTLYSLYNVRQDLPARNYTGATTGDSFVCNNGTGGLVLWSWAGSGAQGALSGCTTTFDMNQSSTTNYCGASCTGTPTSTFIVANTGLTRLTYGASFIDASIPFTRFYLSSTAAAPAITPAFDAWTRTSEADRLKMSPTKDSSAATSKTFWANAAAAANATCLNRQYISDAMAAGIAFSTSDLIQLQVRCQESAANDNINRAPICLKVYDSAGTTLQATLLGLGHVGPNTTEWVASPTAATNKSVADGDALTAGYTTAAGDYLVLEIGGQVSASAGTSVTGTQVFGSDNGTDLAVNETDTAGDPWFEISRTITFGGGGGGRTTHNTRAQPLGMNVGMGFGMGA